MKKTKFLAICLFIFIFAIACHKKDVKPELKEKELVDFLYKTIKWQQFWFNRWDNSIVEKLLNKRQNIGVVTRWYSINNKWMEYYIYIEELKSIICIRGNNYRSLRMCGIDDDTYFKETEYKTARDYFYKMYYYCEKIKEIKVGFKPEKIFDPEKENNFDFNKEKIVEKVMLEFFQNSVTFEGKTPQYEKILKNRRAIIRVGNFYLDYPAIVFYIKNCMGDKPCPGEIIRDINNEVIANGFYDSEKDIEKYKYTIDKLNKYGAWFVWENNKVRYISDIRKYNY